MPDLVKPTLATIHDTLQAVEKYLLEIGARAQTTGAPTIVLATTNVQGLAQILVKAVMDLEALQTP